MTTLFSDFMAGMRTLHEDVMRFCMRKIGFLLAFINTLFVASSSFAHEEKTWSAIAEIKPVATGTLSEEQKEFIFSLNGNGQILSEIKSFWFDLNGDSLEDVFVFYTQNGECPSSGCRIRLFLKFKDGYSEISYPTALSLQGTYILKNRTNGMHDMMFISLSSAENLINKEKTPVTERYARRIWRNNHYEMQDYIEINYPASFSDKD